MEEKYKVLWLDDAFASESSDKLNERLEKFQQTSLANSFEIKKVVYAEDFMQEFAKNHYDVVILDVFGYSKTDVNNKTVTDGFQSALNAVKISFCVKIVYTGETYQKNEDLQKYIMNNAKNEGFEVFNKIECPIPDLFKHISSKFDDLFFKDCPTLRELFLLESFSESAKGYLQEIRQEYNEVMGKGKDPSQKGLNSLRYCMETIFKDDVVKNKIVVYDKKNRLGDYMYALYDKEQCPVLVGQSLIYLLNLANQLDHEDKTSQETFSGYGRMMFRAIYFAFFTCVEWYYNTFKAKKEDPLSINIDKDSKTCESDKYTQSRLCAGKEFVGVIVDKNKIKYIKYSSIYVAIETNDTVAFHEGIDVAFVAQSRPNNKNPDKDYWFTTDVKLKEDK